MFDHPTTTRLYHGDCLDVMLDMPEASVDFILTDPPYGTTSAPWDTVIPYWLMWKRICHVLKPQGVVVLFGTQPFTSAVIQSHPKMFKYCWYWKKSQHSNPFLAKVQPLRVIEDIMVFYMGRPTYNVTTNATHIVYANKTRSVLFNGSEKAGIQTRTGYPKNVLEYKRERGFHPTQKPVPLLEYLISVYTNPGETVLDFTMGSGSTGVAAQNINRNFIGIELDQAYFDVAKRRMGV